MGRDFYRRSIACEQKYARSGITIERTLQTNGTLLDEEWCTFLREHHYLVGLSLDGWQELHDAYRVDKAGHPTFDRVLHAARLLEEHKVEFNILCAVSAANVTHPIENNGFFR